jgi:phosphoglucosamine mutase
MTNRLFGTDGIRGIANQPPMTVQTAFRLAQVLGTTKCRTKKRVVLGTDTRLSADMLKSAMIAGFTSVGTDVIDLGVVPTPLLTGATENLDVDAAVMITASHNPYADNGIKVINAHGDKLDDSETAQIESMLLSDRVIEVSPDSIGHVIHDKKPIAEYLNRALSVAPTLSSLKGLRVVLDCANGAFSDLLPTVFKTLGADALVLAASPNGRNINEDCGSQHTETLQRAVVETQAQLGIAVDGDGDRLIVCDDKGNRIDGDQIIAFLAGVLQRAYKLKTTTVVATIWSNLGLEKYLNSLGIRLARTPVGERYVIEEMRKTGANLGGEESGHMVLSDYTKTGDALIAGLIVALGLLKSGKKASEIFPVFRKCPCLITSVRFKTADDAATALTDPILQEQIKLSQEKLASHGSLIVRKSGTEPVIKIRVESEDQTVAEEISRLLTETVSKL